MDKKIENYLHLYLGCECEFKTVETQKLFSRKLIGIDIDYLFQPAYDRNPVYEYIKPILRPLVSLTLKEDQVVFPKNNRGHKIDMHWFPEGFAWLLKNQFDLFGLIEAGLAISKVEASHPLKTE